MNRIIETERLILRPVTLEDASDVFEWVGDPVVNRYMPYSIYNNIEQVKVYISKIIKEGKYEFAFYSKENKKVIGAGSIKYDEDTKAYELGYNLNRKFWNKGYATEASKAIIQWAYQTLNARDFVAAHVTANIASGKVLLKCGFTFDYYGQYSRFDGSEVFDASFYKMHLD